MGKKIKNLGETLTIVSYTIKVSLECVVNYASDLEHPSQKDFTAILPKKVFSFYDGLKVSLFLKRQGRKRTLSGGQEKWKVNS